MWVRVKLKGARGMVMGVEFTDTKRRTDRGSVLF